MWGQVWGELLPFLGAVKSSSATTFGGHISVRSWGGQKEVRGSFVMV